MKKLMLAFALLLTATAAAHAQTPTDNSAGDNLRAAMRMGDPARNGEALISASRASNARSEDEADAARRARPRTFNAEVVVTNSAARAIESVTWTATLVNPDTGSVIRSYDVTTQTRIAPGKTKKLSKLLQTPRDNVVKATSSPPRKAAVADLKVKVKAVTYADGTTSTTP